MMHFGGIQKDSFEMMDLEQYISYYGRKSLNNFLRDKDAINQESTSRRQSLLRRSTAINLQNWKDNSEHHFYVPVQEKDKNIYRKNLNSIKFFVDFVKPTAQIEIMKIHVFNK